MQNRSSSDTQVQKLKKLMEANRGVVLRHGFLLSHLNVNTRMLRQVVYKLKKTHKADIWTIDRQGYVYWGSGENIVRGPRIPESRKEICLPSS